MSPVTACTDLLRPTGYRRLPRYLKALEADLERYGARTVDQYIVARAGTAKPGAPAAAPPGAPEAGSVRAAALANLSAYAARLPLDPRYHAAQNRAEPRRLPSRLALFDCDSCNACVVVCPNDAFFSLPTGVRALDTWDLVIVGKEVERRAATFEVARAEQWAVYADFCNECGNCETFCPEAGGPQVAKPRFHGSRASYEAAAPRDAILVEEAGDRVRARFAGREHELARAGGRERFGDGVLEVEIEGGERIVWARAREWLEGHTLPMWRYHALRLLRDAALAGVNPVSAPFLPVGGGQAGPAA
jgi:putative selenate reductase